MKHWDLIVIGMGLAGLTAARTAVEMGAKVLIVGRGIGSLALFGNTIDVLGTVPPATDLAAGVARWIAAHPDHPYARMGWGGIAESLGAFRELFPAPYSFAPVGGGKQPRAHWGRDTASRLPSSRDDGRRSGDHGQGDADRRLQGVSRISRVTRFPSTCNAAV